MSDITFTFGFSDSFIFATPVATCSHNLPSELEKRLERPATSHSSVRRTSWCALGPHGTYMLGHVDGSGEDKIAWNWQDYSPFELFKNWAAIYLIDQKRCVVGPSKSFFGIAGDSQPYLWKRVPAGLEAIALRDGGNPIVCVALGYATHWAAIRKDGTVDWPRDKTAGSDFYGHLDRAQPGSITHIALCPDDSRSYFIAYANGMCEYWLPKKKGMWEKVGRTAELYRDYVRTQQELSGAVEAPTHSLAAHLEPVPIEDEAESSVATDASVTGSPPHSYRTSWTQRFLGRGNP